MQCRAWPLRSPSRPYSHRITKRGSAGEQGKTGVCIVDPDLAPSARWGLGWAIRRFVLIAGALAAIALAGSLAASDLAFAAPPRVREDVKDLTPQEKADFVDAVLELKQTPSP